MYTICRMVLVSTFCLICNTHVKKIHVGKDMMIFCFSRNPNNNIITRAHRRSDIFNFKISWIINYNTNATNFKFYALQIFEWAVYCVLSLDFQWSSTNWFCIFYNFYSTFNTITISQKLFNLCNRFQCTENDFREKSF